jgi:hypothetical protein
LHYPSSSSIPILTEFLASHLLLLSTAIQTPAILFLAKSSSVFSSSLFSVTDHVRYARRTSTSSNEKPSLYPVAQTVTCLLSILPRSSFHFEVPLQGRQPYVSQSPLLRAS